MKNLLYLFSLSLILACISCSTTQNSLDKESNQTADERRLENQANKDLADALRKNTNITVLGQGSDVKVLIRGTSSFGQHGQHTQPLYVIDGVAIGNSYVAANRVINPNDIKSIQILSSLSEVATYGERGNHGVIKIRTHKSMTNK